MPVSRNASRLSVMFDDDHAVADAGLALVGVLSEKLGLIELAEEMVNVPPFPGRRIATLVHAMVAGADCIDDADLLRSASTAEVLGHKVMAPSTLATFIRSFTFGHVRQLEAVIAEVLHARLARARRTPGAGCGASSRSSCPGFVAPGPAASSWCAAILALGRTTRWPSGPPR